MNEQQRKEMSHIQQGDSTDKTAVHEKPLYEKTSADFAKYFETTYEPPNINKARKRGRDDIEVHYDFTIAEDMRNIGQDKKFLRSEEHTSELQSRGHLVCRLLLEKKKKKQKQTRTKKAVIQHMTKHN